MAYFPVASWITPAVLVALNKKLTDIGYPAAQTEFGGCTVTSRDYVKIKSKLCNVFFRILYHFHKLNELMRDNV